MAEINWGLAGGNNALQYFQLGSQLGAHVRQRREEGETRKALASYAANPSDPNALSGLIQADPRLGIQLQGQQAQASRQQQEQRRADLPLVGRLLDSAKDEASYQNARNAAQQYGIDVSQIPAAYDPAWVEQQRTILRAMGTDDSKISGLARELTDAGYDLSSPEGQAALRSVISNKYASEYVDEQGNTRRRSGLNLGGGMQAQPQPTIQNTPAPGVGENGMPATLTPEQYQAVVAQKGERATQEWAQRNGVTISKNIGGQTYYQVNGQWYDNPEGR